jgi:hypothetical protein
VRTAKKQDLIADAMLIADSAWNVLSEQHPGWSIDKLLINPRRAIEVCRLIRRQLHYAIFPLRDDDILGCLLNGRKRGWIDARDVGKRRKS